MLVICEWKIKSKFLEDLEIDTKKAWREPTKTTFIKEFDWGRLSYLPVSGFILTCNPANLGRLCKFVEFIHEKYQIPWITTHPSPYINPLSVYEEKFPLFTAHVSDNLGNRVKRESLFKKYGFVHKNNKAVYENYARLQKLRNTG